MALSPDPPPDPPPEGNIANGGERRRGTDPSAGETDPNRTTTSVVADSTAIIPTSVTNDSPWSLGSIISRLRHTPSSQRPNTTVVTPDLDSNSGSKESPVSSSVSDASHTTELAGVLGRDVELEDAEAALQLVLQQKRTQGPSDNPQIAPNAQNKTIHPTPSKPTARTLTFGDASSPPVTIQSDASPSHGSTIPIGTPVPFRRKEAQRSAQSPVSRHLPDPSVSCWLI